MAGGQLEPIPNIAIGGVQPHSNQPPDPCQFYHIVSEEGTDVAAPKKDVGIRDDTARVDMALPRALIRRVETIAAFLGLTRRATMLIILNEGCRIEEGKILDAKQARENATAE